MHGKHRRGPADMEPAGQFEDLSRPVRSRPAGSVAVGAVVTLTLAVGGAGYYEYQNPDSWLHSVPGGFAPQPTEPVGSPVSSQSESESPSPGTPTPSAVDSPSSVATAAKLSPAACIAQLPRLLKIDEKLMIGVTSAEDLTAKTALATKYNIGGIILMKQMTADQIAAFRRAQMLPPLISTDNEGGTVQRDTTAGLMPAAANVPGTMTPAAYEAIVKKDALSLRRKGINMNLAPVTDVVAPSGPNFLGSRMFSKDPVVVAHYVRAALRGDLAGGVLPTMKHAPGLGTATINTDVKPAKTASQPALVKRDEVPYQRLVGTRVGQEAAIMLNNAVTPGLSGGLPNSLSPASITLMRSLGYKNNIIITDSLSAGAITAKYSIAEAAVQSMIAGTDIELIVSPGTGTTMQTVVRNIDRLASSAIENGSYKRSDMNASIGRLFAERQINPCRLLASMH